MASGSATFSGSYGSHFRLEVNYGLVSQNIANNSSVVRVWINLFSDGYGSMYGVTSPLTLQINGGSGIENVGININTNSGITLFSRDYTVGHNADGTKTMNVYAKLAINGYGYGEAAWGTNYTLPTIPRASTSSDITGTLGTALTINISRASSSFTHTLTYAYGSLTGTIASGVGTSVSWTPPLGLANAMPNKTTDWGNFTVTTYNGSTKIGSKTYKMTMSIPASVVPALGSITLAETNTTCKTLLNSDSVFVQNKSNIKVTFNNASGNTGSSISQYKAQIVDRSNSSNGNGATLGLMNYSGTVTVKAWVVDSRGRSSTAITKKITILEYKLPAFTFTAERGNDTNSSTKVTVKRTAQISRLLVNGVQKNTFKLEFAYSTYSSTTKTSDTGANINTTTGIYSLINSSAVLSASFDVGTTYKIYGKLTDAFGGDGTGWIEYEVHPEKMVWGEAENTFSFGKYPEITNAVDSAWPYYYDNRLIQNYALTNLIGGKLLNKNLTDINSIWDPGYYYVDQSATGNPCGAWGQMIVLSPDGIGATRQPMQIFIPDANGDGIYTRRHVRSTTVGNWERWRRYAVQNSAAEFTSVNQTKVYSATLPGPYGMNLNARRVGNIVSVTLNTAITSTTSRHGTASEIIPVGWRPIKEEHIVSAGFAGGGTGSQMWTGETFAHLTYMTDGKNGFTLRATAQPVAVFGSISWITTDPYPS